MVLFTSQVWNKLYMAKRCQVVQSTTQVRLRPYLASWYRAQDCPKLYLASWCCSRPKSVTHCTWPDGATQVWLKLYLARWCSWQQKSVTLPGQEALFTTQACYRTWHGGSIYNSSISQNLPGKEVLFTSQACHVSNYTKWCNSNQTQTVPGQVLVKEFAGKTRSGPSLKL